MRRALALLTISLLLGCQSAPTSAPRVVALVLSRPLIVPPARAAVEVQAGELRDGRIDPYRPYCRFELARLADVGREIAPGRYPILRQYKSVPAAAAPSGLRHANLMAAADGGPELLRLCHRVRTRVEQRRPLTPHLPALGAARAEPAAPFDAGRNQSCARRHRAPRIAFAARGKCFTIAGPLS